MHVGDLERAAEGTAGSGSCRACMHLLLQSVGQLRGGIYGMSESTWAKRV